MFGAEFVRRLFRTFGLEIIRLGTHRAVLLESDLKRLSSSTAPMNVFDVGANIGDFSAQIRIAFPHARIVAFEPVPETFEDLARRYRSDGRTRCEPFALGAHDGTAQMLIQEQSSWARVTTAAAEDDASNTVEVGMATVDQYCAEHGIKQVDLLKTDCEGHDLAVLEGAAGMLSNQAVKAVYCEVNFHRNQSHGDFFKLNELLESFGYTCYGFYDYSGVGYSMEHSFTNALWTLRSTTT